ncbi:hypothetical protein SY88_03630 [Clostridiales bacterium PH28_bin88]|nr:hypothetical protein SY88_03630 [Clostridiales bacterium PH28_bin88]
MKIFWWLLLAIIITFSVSTGAYLALYKFPLSHPWIKGVALVVVSLVLMALASALVVLLVWPPPVWSVFFSS